MINIKKVMCLNRDNIPPKDIDILEDFLDSKILDDITEVDIYQREVKVFPFGHANWIIDIYFGEDIFCVKLPMEMLEQEVIDYCKPILKYMKLDETGH